MPRNQRVPPLPSGPMINLANSHTPAIDAGTFSNVRCRPSPSSPSHPLASSTDRHTCLPGPPTQTPPIHLMQRHMSSRLFVHPPPRYFCRLDPLSLAAPQSPLRSYYRAAARIHLSHRQAGLTPHSLLTALRSIVRSSWANGAHLRVRLPRTHTISMTSTACHHTRAKAGPSQTPSLPLELKKLRLYRQV